MLGLDPHPEDAPFIDSTWLDTANDAELRRRLAYFPNRDDLIEKIHAYRANDMGESPVADSKDAIEDVTRKLARLAQSLLGPNGAYAELLDSALRGTFELTDSFDLREGDVELNEIVLEALANIRIPWLLHETIYGASGNRFLPIYVITEPMHGVDVSVWADYQTAGITAAVGPTGIRASQS